MKSFDRAFSKARGVLGQSLKSRPQARNSFYGVFWFFFAPTCTKKNGDNFLNVNNEHNTHDTMSTSPGHFCGFMKNQVIQKNFKKSLTRGAICGIITPLVNPMSKNIEKIYARY
jgi:hypothetical protein